MLRNIHMLDGYEKRIGNPVFEIEITFSGRLHELADYVVLCDMAYELDDDEDYMKDFMGSYLDPLLADDLKILLCHVDYYRSASLSETECCCPLYTMCNHPLRQSKPQQCKKNPRLCFEAAPEFGWCNYSLGIGYMTGVDKVD